MREYIHVVAQRIPGYGDHEILRLPHYGDEAIRIVRFEEDLGDAAEPHVFLEVPYTAYVSVPQLALKHARRQTRVVVQIALHLELRPACSCNRLDDDRAEHDQRAQRAVAVARRKRDLPHVILEH